MAVRPSSRLASARPLLPPICFHSVVAAPLSLFWIIRRAADRSPGVSVPSLCSTRVAAMSTLTMLAVVKASSAPTAAVTPVSRSDTITDSRPLAPALRWATASVSWAVADSEVGGGAAAGATSAVGAAEARGWPAGRYEKKGGGASLRGSALP